MVSVASSNDGESYANICHSATIEAEKEEPANCELKRKISPHNPVMRYELFSKSSKTLLRFLQLCLSVIKYMLTLVIQFP